MPLTLVTREQQELAGDMMAMESRIHHFAKQILENGELAAFKAMIEAFDAKILNEPYATIYAANTDAGATLTAIKGIYDDLKAFSDTLNAESDVIDICDHVEGI